MFSLQVVDDDGLGGVVGGRVLTACGGDGEFLGIVIRPVSFVELAMFGGELGLAQLFVEEGEVVVGGEVFGVDGEGAVKGIDGFLESGVLLCGLESIHLGAFEEGLSEFIEDDDIEAEVELALLEFGVGVLDDGFEFLDGLVEVAILFIGETVEPGDGPAGCWGIEAGGALEGGYSVIEPAFLEVDAGEVKGAVSAAEFFDFEEGLFGLAELAFIAAFFSFEQEADAVVIPAFPGGDGGRGWLG